MVGSFALSSTKRPVGVVNSKAGRLTSGGTVGRCARAAPTPRYLHYLLFIGARALSPDRQRDTREEASIHGRKADSRSPAELGDNDYDGPGLRRLNLRSFRCRASPTGSRA